MAIHRTLVPFTSNRRRGRVLRAILPVENYAKAARDLPFPRVKIETCWSTRCYPKSFGWKHQREQRTMFVARARVTTVIETRLEIARNS